MKKTLLTAALLITLGTATAQTEFNIGIGMSNPGVTFTNREVSIMASFVYLQANFRLMHDVRVVNLGVQFKVNDKFSYIPIIGRSFNKRGELVNYGMIMSYRFVDRFRIYTGISSLEGYKVGISVVVENK